MSIGGDDTERQHASREGGHGEHHISIVGLRSGLLQGYGLRVFHAVGHGERARSIIVEHSILHYLPVAFDTQGGGLIGGVHHLDDDASTILHHGGAHAQVARVATKGQAVL